MFGAEHTTGAFHSFIPLTAAAQIQIDITKADED